MLPSVIGAAGVVSPSAEFLMPVRPGYEKHSTTKKSPQVAAKQSNRGWSGLMETPSTTALLGKKLRKQHSINR